MRSALVLLSVALAGCPSRSSEIAGLDDGLSDADGSAPYRCVSDRDCEPAAATCCECPAFAVHVDEPTNRACDGVACPMSSCSANVRAACDDDGACVLACVAMACPSVCANGYQMDATGCLSCECAPAAEMGCTTDDDCVQTRADCCGCAQGGADTAVLATEQEAFDAALGCGTDAACPGVEVCDQMSAPRCIQGRCELLSAGALPVQACGRADLMPCPDGTVCTVNSDPNASEQGVGVCGPP